MYLPKQNYEFSDRKPKTNIIKEVLITIGLVVLVAIVWLLISLAAIATVSLLTFLSGY